MVWCALEKWHMMGDDECVRGGFSPMLGFPPREGWMFKSAYSSILYTGPSLYFMLLALGLLLVLWLIAVFTKTSRFIHYQQQQTESHSPGLPHHPFKQQNLCTQSYHADLAYSWTSPHHHTAANIWCHRYHLLPSMATAPQLEWLPSLPSLCWLQARTHLAY